jgi:mannose-6-phosphate isomerase-like protein (cupin superfamily)
VLAKVAIRQLVTHHPPLAAPLGPEGGRIFSAAGELAQLVSGASFRYLAYIEFRDQPHVVRGNHYHRVKHEYVYVLVGRLRCTCADLESGERAAYEVAAGDIVEIAPGCAHAFVPLAYSQALEFAPQPYDPADAYHYLLEAPRDEHDEHNAHTT